MLCWFNEWKSVNSRLHSKTRLLRDPSNGSPVCPPSHWSLFSFVHQLIGPPQHYLNYFFPFLPPPPPTHTLTYPCPHPHPPSHWSPNVTLVTQFSLVHHLSYQILTASTCQYVSLPWINLLNLKKNLILPPPPPQLISLTHTYQVEKVSYVMQNPRNRICWFTKNVGQFINKIGLAPTRWCEQIYVVGLGLGLGLRLGVGLGVRGEGSGVEGSPGTKGMGGELVPNWGPMGCWS